MKIHILAAAAALTLLAGSALAADSTVGFGFGANMQSLRDSDQKDRFAVKIEDNQISTTFDLVCNAGTTAWLGLSRTDETCSVSGKGAVAKPGSNPVQWLPRTQYLGGFTITKTGYTDGSDIKVNYLTLGNVPATTGQFGGNLIMKPENPSPSAAAIGAKLISQVTGNEGGVIDERIDTVSLENFYIPSAGLPADKGCSWSGDLVYAYQTDSWLMKLKANCTDKDGAKTFELSGNMPWIDVDEEGNAQYALNLALPSAAATSDDALFAEEGGDLFAAADGISGVINITQSGFVTVEVDGQPEELASQVQATGTLTGTNVPTPVVRSFATLMAVLSRTFFGA